MPGPCSPPTRYKNNVDIIFYWINPCCTPLDMKKMRWPETQLRERSGECSRSDCIDFFVFLGISWYFSANASIKILVFPIFSVCLVICVGFCWYVLWYLLKYKLNFHIESDIKFIHHCPRWITCATRHKVYLAGAREAWMCLRYSLDAWIV